MKIRISIIALGALCSLFSGCGCSKEKDSVNAGVPSRMEDAAYTNQLVQLRTDQAAAAARAAAVRAKLAQFPQDRTGTPEYVALTNQLVQCLEESDRLRKATLNVIRTRILKESAEKGVLKK